MAMTRMAALSAVVALTLPLLCAAADERWSFDAYVGDAYNWPARLEIEQDGGYSRSVRADYETRGFDRPLYYVLRAARWQAARAWEVSLLHYKLYLTNPPDGSRRFPSATASTSFPSTRRARRRMVLQGGRGDPCLGGCRSRVSLIRRCRRQRKA
jgi:hypothetical protein